MQHKKILPMRVAGEIGQKIKKKLPSKKFPAILYHYFLFNFGDFFLLIAQIYR